MRPYWLQILEFDADHIKNFASYASKLWLWLGFETLKPVKVLWLPDYYEINKILQHVLEKIVYVYINIKLSVCIYMYIRSRRRVGWEPVAVKSLGRRATNNVYGLLGTFPVKLALRYTLSSYHRLQPISKYIIKLTKKD